MNDTHWHLDKRFTIGNILTMMTLFVSVIVYVFTSEKQSAQIMAKLDQRIALVEQTVKFQGDLIALNESRRDEQYREIKGYLQEIVGELKRKADK